jgi:hypothetical protein
MSGFAAVESGSDTARLAAHVILHGTLTAAEAGSDTTGSTLMDQVWRALSPLASGGAWPGRYTIEPPVYPYITFFRVVTSAEITFDGPTDVQSTRIQIDVMARRYADADRLARQVTSTMVGGFVVGALDSQDFPPDPDTDAYRISTDVTVWSAD